MSETPLDAAHAAMEDSDAKRLAFFERFADSELYLLLDGSGEETSETPRLFETSDGPLVLAFDTEDRLSAFAGGPAHYAALSGRAISVMLNGQSVGIAFNPDVAPSAMVIPPDAIAWLHNLLAEAPTDHQARPVEVRPPTAPPRLIEGLDAKLASAAGLASHAWLADVTYDDGGENLLLALVATAPGAEAALAQAVSEALTFSGLETGVLDVAFFAEDDPITEKLARVGLRIDLPIPETPKQPGIDPKTPPRLR